MFLWEASSDMSDSHLGSGDAGGSLAPPIWSIMMRRFGNFAARACRLYDRSSVTGSAVQSSSVARCVATVSARAGACGIRSTAAHGSQSTRQKQHRNDIAMRHAPFTVH